MRLRFSFTFPLHLHIFACQIVFTVHAPVPEEWDCAFFLNRAMRLGELHMGRYINYEFNVLGCLPV